MPGWNGCHPGKRCLREFIIESIFDSSEQKYHKKLNLLRQSKIMFQIWKILFIKSKNFAPFLTVVKNWFNRLKHSARYVTNILKNLHIYQTQAGLSPKLDQFKNKVWSQKEVHLKKGTWKRGHLGRTFKANNLKNFCAQRGRLNYWTGEKIDNFEINLRNCRSKEVRGGVN